MLRTLSALIQLPSCACFYFRSGPSSPDIIIAVDAELHHRLPPRAAPSNSGIIILENSTVSRCITQLTRDLNVSRIRYRSSSIRSDPQVPHSQLPAIAQPDPATALQQGAFTDHGLVVSSGPPPAVPGTRRILTRAREIRKETARRVPLRPGRVLAQRRQSPRRQVLPLPRLPGAARSAAPPPIHSFSAIARLLTLLHGSQARRSSWLPSSTRPIWLLRTAPGVCTFTRRPPSAQSTTCRARSRAASAAPSSSTRGATWF